MAAIYAIVIFQTSLLQLHVMTTFETLFLEFHSKLRGMSR